MFYKNIWRFCVLFSVFIFQKSFASNQLDFRLMEGRSLYDVVAPILSANPATADQQVGMIYIYNGQFKGVSAGGTIVDLSASTGNFVNSTGSERVERAHLTSTCTTGTCTIASQSGGFSSITHSGAAGSYSGTFATAFNTSAPTCVCSLGNTNGVCRITSTSTTGVNIEIFNSVGVAANGYFHIICAGPR